METIKNNHKKVFVNDKRKPAERRARYCYLRSLGLSRSAVRGIVGRSDAKIVQTLEYLNLGGQLVG